MSFVDNAEQSGNQIPDPNLARPESLDPNMDLAFSELVKHFIGLKEEVDTTAAELKKTKAALSTARASILHSMGKRKRVMTTSGDFVTWDMVTRNYKEVPAKPARTTQSVKLTVIPGDPVEPN